MRRSSSVIVGLTTILILGVGAFVAFDDSHHTNLPWLLWKHHLLPYNRERALRYLNADVDFRLSLNGKSNEQLRAWFPILSSIDSSDPFLAYCGDYVRDPEFRWIDGTRWGVIFEHGRVKEIVLVKG